jgi:SAM-dependent methyltransferase
MEKIMRIKQIRKNFIERTASKPAGEWAIRNYNDPKAHYKSFRVIMDLLKLGKKDLFCEIGCGGGVLLAMALKKASGAAAIDHSPDMVELARKNNEEDIKQSRVEIVQGDAGELPWQDNYFTACGCANMFFFVEKPEKTLREIYRVLKPGGRFAMHTMSKGLLGKITFGMLYGMKVYSDKTMHTMLENAGFKNVKVKSNLICMQFCYGEK